MSFPPVLGFFQHGLPAFLEPESDLIVGRVQFLGFFEIFDGFFITSGFKKIFRRVKPGIIVVGIALDGVGEILFGGVVVFPDRQDDAQVDEQEDIVLVDFVRFLEFFSGLQIIVFADGIDALVEKKFRQLIGLENRLISSF